MKRLRCFEAENSAVRIVFEPCALNWSCRNALLGLRLSHLTRTGVSRGPLLAVVLSTRSLACKSRAFPIAAGRSFRANFSQFTLERRVRRPRRSKVEAGSGTGAASCAAHFRTVQSVFEQRGASVFTRDVRSQFCCEVTREFLVQLSAVENGTFSGLQASLCPALRVAPSSPYW